MRRVEKPQMGTAAEIAAAVRARTASAYVIADQALARIEATHARINAFTAVTEDRALAAAGEIDALALATGGRGADELPLAGVPFAVKNLFDVAGLATLAGSIINRERPPAAADATAVRRLHDAGAVLLGALNMDEYAFGFTTQNTHYGPTRNPRDPSRIAGGSSGGSAAAVAAGLVPIALGTDTGGSIRVPAALCGVYGLKPTFGRVSRQGVFPFSSSMDHVGPFARTVADLALAYDALQGPDPADPACADRERAPVGRVLGGGVDGLVCARLAGYFARFCGPQSAQGVDAVIDGLAALGARIERRELPETERARAAAFLLSPAEGGNLHRANLAARARDFDPMIRDRLLAGALIPASWLDQAQRFRRWYRDRVLEVLRDVDVLVAAATPWPAYPIGTQTLDLNGESLPAGPNTGLLTQPFSFIGLPVLVVPIQRPGAMPVGVQLIAAPWREEVLFRVAAGLEAVGVCSAPVAAV